MNLKFFTMVTVLFSAVCLIYGADPVSLEIKPADLKVLYGASLETVNNTQVLKLVSKSDKGHPQGFMTVELDPAVAYYELSYSVKTENIMSGKGDMYGADIILKPAKGGALRFSSRGSYKCDIGTMDWKKVSFKINAKRYLRDQPVKVTLRIAYAPGTAWYKDIKLTPVLPKK